MLSLIHLRSWYCFLCITLFLISPQTAISKDSDEDDLLQGINSYRQSQQLPQLTKNKKAGCLADEIANQMDKKPCPPVLSGPTMVMGQSPISTYSSLVEKCKIEPGSATDGIVLPVCVRKLVSTLVLSNYTRSPFGRYLNDSKYTGVGMGSEDDWMVMVLTTNAQSGSFSGGGNRCFVGNSDVFIRVFFLVLFGGLLFGIN